MKINFVKLLAGSLIIGSAVMMSVNAAEVERFFIGNDWTCSYMRNGVNYQTLKNGINKRKTNGECSTVLSRERAVKDIHSGMCLGPNIQLQKKIDNNIYTCEYFKQSPSGLYVPLKKGRYVHKLSSYASPLYEERVMYDISKNRCTKQEIKYSDL